MDINLLPGRLPSVIVDAGQPVVVARALAFGRDRHAHGDGLTMRRGTNVAAEGTTVNRFETYLTIRNPADRRARVTARFCLAGPLIRQR